MTGRDLAELGAFVSAVLLGLAGARVKWLEARSTARRSDEETDQEASDAEAARRREDQAWTQQQIRSAIAAERQRCDGEIAQLQLQIVELSQRLQDTEERQTRLLLELASTRQAAALWERLARRLRELVPDSAAAEAIASMFPNEGDHHGAE